MILFQKILFMVTFILRDGTTTFTTGSAKATAANIPITMSLAGYFISPAGNLRISCQDSTSTSGKILYNQSGLSKDATIYGLRIQ